LQATTNSVSKGGRGHSSCGGPRFVIYVSFSCVKDTFFDALFAVIARRFAIAPLLTVPRDVDVVSRTDGKSEFIFLLNNSRVPFVIELPKSFKELLSNSSVAESLTLPALEVCDSGASAEGVKATGKPLRRGGHSKEYGGEMILALAALAFS